MDWIIWGDNAISRRCATCIDNPADIPELMRAFPVFTGWKKIGKKVAFSHLNQNRRPVNKQNANNMIVC
jgi:hypothetical protein